MKILDGNGNQASFNSPQGIYFDSFSNNLLIADSYNNVIRSMNQSGLNILFLSDFIPIPSSLITFIFKIIFQGYVSTLVNFTNVVSSLITMDSNQILYFASTNYYIYRATANQVSYGPDSSSQIYSFNMNNGM